MKKNFINLTLLLLIFISFSYLYLKEYQFFAPFNKKVADLVFLVRGEKASSKDIVIVDIDEKSLREVGQWPWQRFKVARLVDILTQSGAAIIGFDIVFSEKDNSSPKRVLEELNIKYSNPPDFDEILAKSIENSPSILGYIFEFEESKVKKSEAPNVPAIFIERNKPDSNFLIEAQNVTPNIPIIQESGYSSGFFNTIPDGDGVVRSIPLLAKYDDSIYPSLVLEIVRVLTDTNRVEIIYSDAGVTEIKLEELTIPTDRFGRLIVNFRGVAKRYTYIPAVDILNKNFKQDQIDGKIVLIGTSASGLLDLRATPFDSTFPGIEIHANALDNIINQDFITTPNWAEIADLGILF